jgi:hypothetical protein
MTDVADVPISEVAEFCEYNTRSMVSGRRLR